MDNKPPNANRRQTLHGLAAAMASFTAPALISANALAQDHTYRAVDTRRAKRCGFASFC
jgi:hypothetical protein